MLLNYNIVILKVFIITNEAIIADNSWIQMAVYHC